MAYVITQNCCNDASCVAVCPVSCIHPSPDEPAFESAEMLHIDPNTCIDCGACADACPVDAIRPATALSSAERPFIELNADYYRDHRTPNVFRRVPAPQPLITSDAPLDVAIVGTGPAGLYSAKALLRHPGVHVHMYDRLPTTGGLINYGVAPDHPATKAVVGQFQFIGDKKRRLHTHLGVDVGTDLHHADLQTNHDAVIYAHGAFNPRRLDIPGSELPESVAATAFVGWYNGHPDYEHLNPRLTGRRAVVIGNGNVALDVARILLTDADVLARTTIAPRAVKTLRASTIDEVMLIGRRGPEHASFTLPEILALAHRADINVIVDPCDIAAVESTAHGPDTNRKLKLLSRIAANPSTSDAKRLVLRFHAAPVSIQGTHRVIGVALSSGECINAGVVIHAIGSRGQQIPGVPFDVASGTIPHADGRVLSSPGGTPVNGVYTTGWIKRGPSGVIGTNRTCAERTVAALLHDHAAGLLRPLPKNGASVGAGDRGGRSDKRDVPAAAKRQATSL